MGNIGSTELVIIFIIALLLLGPKRLPEVGESLGKMLRRFRQASRELRDELDVRRELDLRRDLDLRSDLDAESDARPAVKSAPKLAPARDTLARGDAAETTRAPVNPAAAGAGASEEPGTAPRATEATDPAAAESGRDPGAPGA